MGGYLKGILALFHSEVSSAEVGSWHKTHQSKTSSSSTEPLQMAPVGQRLAKQIGAITFVLPSSHVAMLSHPKEVANVIEDAAAGKK